MGSFSCGCFSHIISFGFNSNFTHFSRNAWLAGSHTLSWVSSGGLLCVALYECHLLHLILLWSNPMLMGAGHTGTSQQQQLLQLQLWQLLGLQLPQLVIPQWMKTHIQGYTFVLPIIFYTQILNSLKVQCEQSRFTCRD
jgi:hypothetical protein